MTLSTYLTFEDNAERRSSSTARSSAASSPCCKPSARARPPDVGVPEDARERIRHVSLPIGESTLMGSDNNPVFGTKVIVSTNFSISYAPNSREDADEKFAALSEGGEVTMPLDYLFWGAYFGSCIDRFDVAWMINWEPTQ